MLLTQYSRATNKDQGGSEFIREEADTIAVFCRLKYRLRE
jgi:hypothetical protein